MTEPEGRHGELVTDGGGGGGGVGGGGGGQEGGSGGAQHQGQVLVVCDVLGAMSTRCHQASDTCISATTIDLATW